MPIEFLARECYNHSMQIPDNTAIVLLPGMDGTGELLRPLAERLSAHRSVQLVGYPTDCVLGYDQLAAYVGERLPSGRFVVLGESFSGPIAIEIAATVTRVAGLVLASSFARHPLPASLMALTPLLDLKWIPTSIIVAALMGSAATPELKVRLRQVLNALPREILRTRAQEVLRVDKRDRLGGIACPVLCLHGRSDRLVSRKYVDEVVAARSGSQVCWLDAPHMLLATHVDAAVDVIEQFCEAFNCEPTVDSV
ncbi:alpha/beta hydrolase [Bradyrhizobium sp.]|jgi:pimeloyl-ACP methyl ester carboxylesterase|uniref:alpha/beta fold hydrolase n=1 Tax=Bradyrhizobium sp. TaxID=376 RepID=UPI002DDD003E|nr:alpha/beta hydrolase [Bradyrhizobium sp.]HEV2155993.1 alpha/beta hydrolase [Bradyrhizobium sp.]